MREVTMCCTTCPTGCALTVTIDDNDQVAKVVGNTCPRGEAFAHKEWTDPVRTLTSTVYALLDGREMLIPVKSKEPLPKKTVRQAMEEINRVTIDHPVTMGEVILSDLAGSGIALVACKSVPVRGGSSD